MPPVALYLAVILPGKDSAPGIAKRLYARSCISGVEGRVSLLCKVRYGTLARYLFVADGYSQVISGRHIS